MIQGLITTRHVFSSAGSIVRSFGLRPYLRCLYAVLSRRKTTFLELVWAH